VSPPESADQQNDSGDFGTFEEAPANDSDSGESEKMPDLDSLPEHPAKPPVADFDFANFESASTKPPVANEFDFANFGNVATVPPVQQFAAFGFESNQIGTNKQPSSEAGEPNVFSSPVF
jgi:hypothetical protein